MRRSVRSGAWSVVERYDLTDPGIIASCAGRKGTNAGANWHRKYGVPTCAPCKAAQAKYVREYRWARAGLEHTHAIPARLLRQLYASVPAVLQAKLAEAVGCWICTAGKGERGCEGHSEVDAGPGEGPGGTEL